MNNPEFFLTKNHKYSSRISGLATLLMVAGFIFILGGIILWLMDSNVLGGSMLGVGIAALILRPLVDGFGLIVYNAEIQMLKDNKENQ